MSSESGHSSTSRRMTAAVGLAVLIGALVLVLVAADEPYHIDELRQVRAYDSGFAEIVDASFAQEQPPLDALLNAGVQRLVGTGDLRQRALPAALGVGSLVLMAVLLVRQGYGLGAVFGVGFMGLATALTSVTAYARPYALPVFLMLGFLLAVDRWFERGRWPSIVAAFGIATLLPLSRTAEPLLFLAAAAAWFVVLAVVRRGRAGPGVWLPLGASLWGLAVAVPVLLRLRAELDDYSEAADPITERLARLVTEVPSVVGAAIGWWPVVLGVVVIAIAVPASRTILTRTWWLAPLAMVPVGFAVVFVLQTPVTQPFYERYVFSWVLPAAVCAAAVVAGATSDRPSEAEGPIDRYLRIGSVALVVVALAGGAVLTAREVTSVELSDWRKASDTIEISTEPASVIVFDAVLPLGSYRTFFAGRPRYLDPQWLAPLSVNIARRPDLVPPDRSVAVMLLNERPSVPGWTAIPIDSWFTLYLPDRELVGPLGAAEASLVFAEHLGPDDGAALCLTAIVLTGTQGADASETMRRCAGPPGSESSERLIEFARSSGIPIPGA